LTVKSTKSVFLTTLALRRKSPGTTTKANPSPIGALTMDKVPPCQIPRLRQLAEATTALLSSAPPAPKLLSVQ